jgi:hypothetical protein
LLSSYIIVPLFCWQHHLCYLSTDIICIIQNYITSFLLSLILDTLLFCLHMVVLFLLCNVSIQQHLSCIIVSLQSSHDLFEYWNAFALSFACSTCLLCNLAVHLLLLIQRVYSIQSSFTIYFFCCSYYYGSLSPPLDVCLHLQYFSSYLIKHVMYECKSLSLVSMIIVWCCSLVILLLCLMQCDHLLLA